MIGSVKGEDEGAKPCWFIIRARRLHGHEVQTRLAKSAAESFKDARTLNLRGAAPLAAGSTVLPRRVKICRMSRSVSINSSLIPARVVKNS